MENDNRVSEKLLKFINNQVGKIWWLKEISKNTRLSKDLRIDGDDAIDFFEAFEKEFNVDLTELDLSNYFNGEGFDPVGISFLIRRIIGKPSVLKKVPKDITLSDLEGAITKGRWVEV